MRSWLPLVALLGAASCREPAGLASSPNVVVFVRAPEYDTLFVANALDGTIERSLPLPSPSSRIAVSPQRDRVAFLQAGKIAVMRFDDTAVVAVGSGAANMAWSPDGTRFVYIRYTGPQLRIVNIATGEDVAVPGAVPGGYLGLEWSPDGERIAFEGTRGGARTIFLVDPDGSDLVDFDVALGATDQWSSGEPTWSPDGTHLAFSRARWVEGYMEYAIWIADVEARAARKVTSPSQLQDVRPSWSPGGEYIAFLRFDGAFADVWVVKSDGGAPRPLTATGNVREESPTWLRR